MPRVGLEPTIPVFERAKTVHVLDCVAAVKGKAVEIIAKFFVFLHFSSFLLLAASSEQSTY
jgi:hypothetical protein